MTAASAASAPRLAHRLSPGTLLADIGGTNARFLSIDADGRPGAPVVLSTREYPSLSNALHHWRGRQEARTLCDAAIAVACPVAGDAVRFTNIDWQFSIDALRREFGFGRLVVVNDAAAIAHALPWLDDDDCVVWQAGALPPERTARVLVAPGTGLGIAALVPNGPTGWQAVAGEGGHVALAARNDAEAALVGRLRTKFGHVSAERALSGPGIVNIYSALLERDGVEAALPAPEMLAERLRQGDDARAVETFAMFADLLGTVAADMALTFGAAGGVFFGGGILPALGDAFDRSRFLSRFADKGRFVEAMQAMPVRLIRHPFPAFVGLAALLAGADGATGTAAAG